MTFWENGIPLEIQHEIGTINKFTKKTGREASVTACAKPGRERLFIANSAKGSTGSTASLGCDSYYGKSERIADVHTHPSGKDTVGILPSQDDFIVNLSHSRFNHRPQIGCITSPKIGLTECFKPKEQVNINQIAGYEDNYGNAGYFMDHVPNDYDINFYERKSGKRVDPSAKELMGAVFGDSKKVLKRKITELHHAGFCEYVRALTVPDNEKIVDECKTQLRKRSFLF